VCTALNEQAKTFYVVHLNLTNSAVHSLQPMIDPDPTPTQVRHLQDELESLLNSKDHRSALKEGAKSWSWDKAKKRLRKKRRAFDHQLVNIFEASRVPTPDDLYSHFDEVWESEVENDLVEAVGEEMGTVGRVGVGAAAGVALGAGGVLLGGGYALLIHIANKRWQAYCKECVQITQEKAESHLEPQESSD